MAMTTRTVSNTNLSKEERVRQRLYVESRQDGGNPSEFLEMLAYVVEERIWRGLGISFEDLIGRPYPTGIGSSIEEIKTIIELHHKHERLPDKQNPRDKGNDVHQRMEKMRQVVRNLLNPTVETHGGDRRSEERDQVDNVNLKTQGGNSESYTLRRLKRDRPDLAEKVVKKELSANAAAIQAGFRPKTITIPLERKAAARLMAKHFDAKEFYEAMIKAKDEMSIQ